MNPLDARRRLLGRNVYKKTVEGNPAIAQGSLARRYLGITMQGWTEQDGAPTPETPVPIVSAGTQNQDAGKWEYEVKLTGANLFDYTDMLKEDGYIHSDYRVSGAISIKPFHVEQGKQYLLIIKGSAVAMADYSSIYFGQDDLEYIDDGATTKVLRTRTGYKAFWNNEERRILLTASRTCEITKCMVHGRGLTERYQVEEFGLLEYAGDINAPYEPYRTPQTVTLTSDRPLTKWDKLEKRNGQWGWVYKSAEIVLDGSEDEAWTVYNIGFKVANILPEVMLMRESYCTQFIRGTGFDENSVWVGSDAGNRDIHFPNVPSYYDAELGDKGLGNFKQHVSENPLTILTYLDEETFLPLTETEQEQMNALYTFRPTTVLSNDCGCNMTLTYKTKKSMGGGNPYGLEIGGLSGGGVGQEFDATNRIRTDYIPFYSPDGSRTYSIVGNPYNIQNETAYDQQKNVLVSYINRIPPAGTWFIRISFSKPDNSDFTQEELNQLIRTFDIERS